VFPVVHCFPARELFDCCWRICSREDDPREQPASVKFSSVDCHTEIVAAEPDSDVRRDELLLTGASLGIPRKDMTHRRRTEDIPSSSTMATRRSASAREITTEGFLRSMGMDVCARSC